MLEQLLQKVQFDWTINVGQIVQTLGLFLAFIGVFFTHQQIKKSAIAHTAHMVKDIIFAFFSDETVQRTYYRIGEPDGFKFDRTRFEKSGSDDERAIDQLLYIFDCVGRLHSLGLIRSEDMLLRYRITKVFMDPEVQAYLKYLDEEVYPKTLGKNVQAFKNARELAKRLITK